MEVRKRRFCCELERSSSFATKSILIFILSLCINLITYTNVKAEVIPPTSRYYMTQDRAQAIIDNAKNGNILFLYRANNDNVYESEITTANSILNGMSATTFMENWNNNTTILNNFNEIEQITNENYSIEDLVIISVFNPNLLEFYVIIANQENSNVLSFLKTNYSYDATDTSKRYYEFLNNNTGQNIYRFKIQIDNNYNFTTTSKSTNSLKLYYSVRSTPNYEFSIAQNGKIKIPAVLSMKNLNSTYMYNDNTLYTTNDNLTGYYYFNNYYNETPAPTPTPIPTSTPTPTSTPDIGTISGQINDINNNITGSTQTIVNQISGDTKKIENAITDKITDEELENILPLSGDYVQQMGYKPQISPYNGFIINIYNIIKEALLGEGNVNLYVEYHGYSEYISSSRYYIPNNPFKIWLTAGMVALICWQIAKFGDQITQKLEKADINVMHYADADMYFF